MRYAALLVAASLCAPACPAQQPASPPTQATTQPLLPVLHIYANLIQIPVLVLSPTRDKVYTPIAPDRFSLSLDNGPWIKAANAHLEGDDPIDLSIVVDGRRPQSDILPNLDQAIARLAPAQLHPTDHVSIYIMACGLLRSVQNVPADSAQLKSAAATALADVTARRVTKDKSPCNDSAPLWDLLTYATGNLAKAPGRRVVLALTNGNDAKSTRTPSSLITLAQNLGVTIFALNPDPTVVTTYTQSMQPPTGYGPQGVPPPGTSRNGLTTQVMGGDLPAIAELTGGIMFHLGGNAYDSLKRAVEMVRDRYILDFPRPTNATAGVHNLQVRIDRGNFFIRPAGDAVPATTPGQNDPNTLHPGSTTPIQLAKTTPAPPAPAPPAAQSTPPQPTQQTSTPPSPASQAAAAQQPATPHPATPPPTTTPLPTPTLKVTTRLTIVNVTVTDKDNHPIRGLQRSDFTIKEDNKPQPIHDFAEYGNAATPPAPAPLPPNTFTNQLTAATGATNVILLDEVTTGLADLRNLAPDNLIYARKASISYLKSMPAGTQVAILLLGNGLHVVQDFSSDRNLLLSALNSVSFKPVEGAYHKVPGDGCEVGNTQSRMQLDALNQVATYLAGIKGRKSLVWFTPGTPWLTNYLLFNNVPCLIDFTPELKRTYGALTAAQVALYPVDPRGKKLTGATAETEHAFDSAGRIAPDADLSGVQGQDPLNDDHASIGAMADATGGIAYSDRNDLDAALAEAIAAGSDYYSLSYIPPRDKQDNLYHSIKVSVDRASTSLQYSSGYSDGDLPALNPAGKNAIPPEPGYHPEMRYDALDSTQLTFNLRPTLVGPRPAGEPFLGSPNPALKNVTFSRYTFHYTFTPSQMAFTDDPGGGRHATIEFVLVAFDADGKPINNLRQQLKLTFHPDQPEAYLNQPFDSPIAFDVPSSTVTLRAGIFDLTAQKSGTIDIPLTPPKP